MSARLTSSDDCDEEQNQEKTTGSEHQQKEPEAGAVDLRAQLKGACAELGLGSIEESLQLPALVKLCWTLQIAADQGYEPPYLYFFLMAPPPAPCSRPWDTRHAPPHPTLP